MPRPRKCRKVCQMPHINEFKPVGKSPSSTWVTLTVDEYETIRLIDKQGFSQEECCSYMEVARTTVQLIYEAARKKIATALVEGLPIKIEGGDFQLCDGKEDFCECGGCKRHRRRCLNMPITEDKNMKIAIPLDENKEDVCIVLARAPFFLIRQNETDSIVENPAAASQSGAGIQVAQFLVDNKIDVLITVRCGQNAADVFKAANMKIFKSANKKAKDDLVFFDEGKLNELTEFHGGFHGGTH